MFNCVQTGSYYIKVGHVGKMAWNEGLYWSPWFGPKPVSFVIVAPSNVFILAGKQENKLLNYPCGNLKYFSISSVLCASNLPLV